KAVIEVQRYSPYELSLDWTVASEKGPFIGRRALLDEKRRGPARRTVGLVIDWRTVEQLYLNMGLPPQPPSAPWRAKIPLYSGYRQVAVPKSGRVKIDRGPARLLFEVKSNPAVRFERSFKDDALVGNPFDHAVRFLHRFEGKRPTGAWLHAGLLARDSARCPMGDVR